MIVIMMPKSSDRNKMKRLTGVAVPLGALYTKENGPVGEFPDLKKFAEFCAEAGIGLIQLLPVNDTGTQSSPYSGLSAFALHPIYISLDKIPGFSELYSSDRRFAGIYDSFRAEFTYSPRYDYQGILEAKKRILREIFDSTETGKTGQPSAGLSAWIDENPWVRNYAVYKNLKWNYMQASWKSWLENDRRKTPEQMDALWRQMAFRKDHLFYAWVQMTAAEQFADAVAYTKSLGIMLKGDMPILMNEDSCDAWAYPEFFNQELRAGSPADGGNPSGQSWGFPTYNWKKLKEFGYSWWKDRLRCAGKYYDAYRLDHILGFFRIWAIPEKDVNALTGHPEPCSAIKRTALYEAGFDDDRIRWLSRPHIPTGLVEDVTWNHDAACGILSVVAERIGGEELWLFKNSVKASGDILSADFGGLCTEQAERRIKELLVKKWADRTLLELSRTKFVPLWTYGQSTSWNSLNQAEKEKLLALFGQNSAADNRIWKKNASEILSELTSAVDMVPCGEDLGVNIECVPQVMKKHGILGLRVSRWCRDWDAENQPFVPAEKYEPLSVTTTSVHDSSTIRQWWQDEKDSVREFVRSEAERFGLEPLMRDGGTESAAAGRTASSEFSPGTARIILESAAETASCWFIPPLQDLLYLDRSCWLEKPEDERINLPGTVSEFNWTYRMPVTVDELLSKKELIAGIKSVVEKHNEAFREWK